MYTFPSTFILHFYVLCTQINYNQGRVDSKQLLSGSKSFTFESRKVYMHAYMYEKYETFMTQKKDSFKMYHIMRMERFV